VTDRKILIAGAGLGGLAAAGCLLKAGYDVEIYEQAPVLGEVGAGIQMSANAMHVLNYLGVGDEISAKSVRPEAYVFRLHDTGELIDRFALSEEHMKLHKAPYNQAHRADLHEILANAIQKMKPGIVHLNKRATHFEGRCSGWRGRRQIRHPQSDRRCRTRRLYRRFRLADHRAEGQATAGLHGKGHVGLDGTGETRSLLLAA
jgi:2-polyprenyl-6-methoxyphenol hydroxylase-like FAD-dependent oxidoreductase